MRFAIIILSIFLYLPASALAWWNNEWSKRVAVTVTVPSQVVAEAPQETLILVKLHAGNFPDFFLLNENLSDLRFVAADDKTPLKFHIDSFDLINQLLFVWVKMPNIAPGGSQKIWMYYSNEKAAAGSDAAGTFDTNLSAAIHFGSKPNVWTDATAYNTPTSIEGAEITSASVIGAGLTLAGNGQFIIQDSLANRFDSTAGFGLSLWAKPIDPTSRQSLFKREDTVNNAIEISIDATGIYTELTIAGSTTLVKADSPIEPAKWHHLAVVVKQNTLSIFHNGLSIKSDSMPPLTLTGAMTLGAASTSATTFHGEIDEIRISQTPLSSLTLLVDAKNQGLVDEVVSLGAPEESGSESASAEAGLFEITLKSMDEAGWVVTIILLVMAFLAWIVMAGKFIYLSRVDKDNKAFMKKFVTLIEKDPAALDQEEKDEDEDEKELEASPIAQALFGNHDHFQSSPLYRLYHRGITEIRGRTKIIQDSGLTTRSNAAIRASLDAQTVREGQRLQSQMIFLTIAISGGPFIGLFGTVMGVMMTFAGIAATGDVNIAAIAPGVSAALLTTLAGLFVAIPALFGYNYLFSRIKANIADMRVFSDEFATRLAEYYGRH